LSSVDKTLTNAYYEIEIEPKTHLPLNIKVVILTGTRGTDTQTKGKTIIGGKHVAFHFAYELSDFGKLKKPTIPPEAQKLLARG